MASFPGQRPSIQCNSVYIAVLQPSLSLLFLFDLPRQRVHVHATAAQNVNTVMTFEHCAVRPRPKAVALLRFQGVQQVFTWQALKLSELDLVQRFIPV